MVDETGWLVYVFAERKSEFRLQGQLTLIK